MTRVDFYVLTDNTEQQRLDFACRLTQKAQSQGSCVYIAVDDESAAAQVDEALWAFRPESFIPHDCEGQLALRAPVMVGFGAECGDHHNLLINLKRDIPHYFSRFERVAEIVCQTEAVLRETREHYSFYRHRHYPIHSHNLSSTK